MHIIQSPSIDYIGDCRNLCQISSESVAELYCSNIFSRYNCIKELPTALSECHRVLISGGKIFICVPDFERLCYLFLSQPPDLNHWYNIMRFVFGSQTSPYEFYKAGLTYDILQKFLSKTGFINVTRVPAFNLFHDMSNAVISGIPISLNMIAEKAR